MPISRRGLAITGAVLAAFAMLTVAGLAARFMVAATKDINRSFEPVKVELNKSHPGASYALKVGCRNDLQGREFERFEIHVYGVQCSGGHDRDCDRMSAEIRELVLVKHKFCGRLEELNIAYYEGGGLISVKTYESIYSAAELAGKGD